jgi:ATP/maltotriose-dependent transcriptional regulator MalT
MQEKYLSCCQHETLALIAREYSNSGITNTLDTLKSTIKSHLSASIALFETDNRTHCMAKT